ncbi:hypothetical protein FQA39_LY05630 [Lamprigera yunnana]|nr:hypothetical protein FQA39_LY05630 [Lamprigera yunnana]
MSNTDEPVVPEKHAKKVKKENVIRDQKVKGEAHINHNGKVVEAKKVGPDCQCKRLKCFTIIAENTRNEILNRFYSIPTKNLQDSHLAGLIKMSPVKQRRSR